MNRVIASVYSVSIGGAKDKDGDWSADVKRSLIDKIPDLIAEIQRLESIVHDPFVKGCMQFRDAIRAELGKDVTRG